MTQSTEWWSTFFSGLAIEFWARLENVDATRHEVDLLVKSLRIAPGAKVLDVPCGNGRHSLELASRGFQVTGIDISPDNITSARDRARARGVEASFEARDMRDLASFTDLDAAICVGNSFSYLTDEGNAEFLRAVAKALKPGGMFTLETGYVLESLLPSFEKRAWYLAGDIYYNADRRLDALTSRLEVDYTFIQGARVEQKHCSTRMYTCLEVLRLFESAGFEIAGAHGSLEGEPYQAGSRSLCVVAVKR